MRHHGTGLALIGLLLASFATRLGPAGMTALLWAAANFVVVGVAYLGQRRHVFGKRPDGGLTLSRAISLAPFLAFTGSVWHLARILSRESAIDSATPRLRLARRLLPGELPAEVERIVDLTAEFPSRIRGPNYRSLPILDGGTPDPAALRRVLDELPRTGVTLIHCAQGHGRTALFAACVLIDHDGLDVDAAVAVVLAARPRARMSRAQRAFVDAFAARRRAG